ncbi:DUF192 domain-containing protein [Halomicrobium salinisoli]|uniref:DUF192 domain-containing protein n=1 Tax=Halomicrobium salinisoli TaxID=2878391 RepID=UPI001CEFCDAF|nr:DUF192 domain-containing protein [Halomicrobium salinisoli]
MVRRSTAAFAVVVAVIAVVALLLQTGLWISLLPVGEYDETTVTVVDGDDEQLGAVEARVADSTTKRLVGLSRTDALGPDEGMLFVHGEAERHAYVMREMDFPLDIVFLAANGTITEIHHASVPSGDGDLREYPGHGRYVLEVQRGWTNRTDTAVGDRVRSPVME